MVVAIFFKNYFFQRTRKFPKWKSFCFEPDINDPGVEAEQVYQCYCLYYERYHMPQEQEQIRIRTLYDEKYNKLRVMTSQM